MMEIIGRRFRWWLSLLVICQSILSSGVYAQTTQSTSAMVFFWAEDVENPGATNWRPLGSGFLVSDQGVVLTAKHVIATIVIGERVIASISDKSAFPVPIDETDIQCAMANRDVCAVRVPPGAIPNPIDRIFAVECGLLNTGMELRALGFVGGGDQFGGVIQPRGEVVGAAMRAGLIPTDLDLVPTMSGGPVLNDRGNVVAIVKGADSTSDNLTFVTPVTSIKSVLVGLNIQCERAETNSERRLRLQQELEKLSEIAAEIDFSIKHQNLRVLPALREYVRQPSQASWDAVVHRVSVVHQRLERAIELEIEFAASLEGNSGSQQVEALLQAVGSADRNLESLESNRYKVFLVQDLALGHSSRSAAYRILSGPPIHPAEAERHMEKLERIALNLENVLNAAIEHYKEKIRELD
ncbi:S1 family peptidase [Aliiroseovarius sp. 2305UL8-7]|uniref:S1 family peptidase n=1 Tax=Aliiroseovarius conchicola TaxID=3121637 RepID=UPI0035283BFD